MAKHTYNLHLKGYVGGCDFDRDYVDYILAKHTRLRVLDADGNIIEDKNFKEEQ